MEGRWEEGGRKGGRKVGGRWEEGLPSEAAILRSADTELSVTKPIKTEPIFYIFCITKLALTDTKNSSQDGRTNWLPMPNRRIG